MCWRLSCVLRDKDSRAERALGVDTEPRPGDLSLYNTLSTLEDFQNHVTVLRSNVSIMKISEITPFGETAYELEKGHNDQQLERGDILQLKFGGVVRGLPSEKPFEDCEFL
jgi:hypothetical protein